MAMIKNNNSELDGMPLQQFLTYRFSRLQAKLNAQGARMLAELAGITVTQWRIIALVGSHGRATSAELTRLGAIDKGLFSRNLKKLIAGGVIQTVVDKGDNRALQLSLSRRGQAIYDRVLPHMRERQFELKSGLSKQEEDVLFRALEKIEAAIDIMEREE